MAKDEVLQVVTHTGDCYRIKCRHIDEPFNFYVSRIGEMFLEQDGGGGLEYHLVSYNSIEWVERYRLECASDGAERLERRLSDALSRIRKEVEREIQSTRKGRLQLAHGS